MELDPEAGVQMRMFEPAPKAIIINAVWEWPAGWLLHVASRREGREVKWGTVGYSQGMTASELITVIDAELVVFLRPPEDD